MMVEKSLEGAQLMCLLSGRWDREQEAALDSPEEGHVTPSHDPTISLSSLHGQGQC